MTAADLLTFAGLFVVIFLLEIALFYASTALGNVDINLSKLLVGAFLAAFVWAGVFIGCMTIFRGLGAPFSPENRGVVLGLSLAGLIISWAIPAVLFVPVLPVSFPRGMLVSVFQLLLRIFLYVLIAAVVMVVLAVLQIRYGPVEKRTPQAAGPTPLVKAA